MKSIVTFTEEELGAIKTIASVRCEEIACSDCPFNITNIPNVWIRDGGCVRNIISDILRSNAQEEKK